MATSKVNQTREVKMNSQAVPKENSAEILYLAFELSHKNWKLGFSDGRMPQIRQVRIEAGDLEGCRKEIAKANADSE